MPWFQVSCIMTLPDPLKAGDHQHAGRWTMALQLLIVSLIGRAAALPAFLSQETKC
jgi:hypothetical protein